MKVSCALYLEVESEQELLTLDWDSLPQPVMVLGGGSNLLFTKDFPGTVLHIALRHCERSEESWTLGAGVVFDDFCAQAAAEGLWGPENLSLIPGECGASAVQNIGAYGVEVKDILADIRAYDRVEGRFVHIDPATCGYGYRTSRFKTEWKGRYIITAVTYRLSREPRPVLDYGGIRKALLERGVRVAQVSEETLTPLVIRDTIIGIRREKLPDPAVTGSAGSFFCNPVVSEEVFKSIEGNPPHYEVEGGIKIPAAWLIEQCGFKGARLGGAQVYPRQPLVIVNATGEASPQEIIGLEKQVIDAVREKFGITLHPEVEHV
jgi:UDP-N-acetylmuramate dehydrogenase